MAQIENKYQGDRIKANQNSHIKCGILKGKDC